MRIFIAGIGPGDCEMITLNVLKAAQECDMIIAPRSRHDRPGTAEKIIQHYIPHKTITHLTFPMTRDETVIQTAIASQLEALLPKLTNIESLLFPVIGDAMLYSTGKYFLDAVKIFLPDAQIIFLPGISAHSLAAACAHKFLAMDTEIFTIIPGTASHERIRAALEATDAAAIYKPSALDLTLDLLENFEAIRVEYAGFDGLERIYYGTEALRNIDEYMSIILLWRKI